MTVRVHAMEREHTKPVIDDRTYRLRRVPLSPGPDRAPVTERRPPMLLARLDRDPPDHFAGLAQHDREVTAGSRCRDPRRCSVLRVRVRDGKHPRHLDTGKLPLNYGSVRVLERPEQKPLRLNPCLVEHLPQRLSRAAVDCREGATKQ